ncbi:phosphatase PAP2 family protein [uncultured Tenacibaculum sp.]|uniref:phosphatase PAP2 family protein n=1 Tax=uncultured Tenacibaculum sp. TaxID=174713 RepID=UPI002609B322|nr:phosphatase PAP2 family protein [uncultured Tenacibaculum sp.]
MVKNSKLEIKVNDKFKNIRLRLFLPPVSLLFIITFILLKESSFSIEGYVKIQKNIFFYLNSELSELPILQFNLTQLGDALISLSLLSVFIVYTPKLWGALLTSSIISLIVSFLLKKIFAVPRPSGMFDTNNFVVIGKTLSGSTSLPSGHSITVFIVVTILLFAFMPKGLVPKIICFVCFLTLGAVIAFSRVGVGAHYPLDVVIGSIIGYIVALIGIIINNKVNWWNWIQDKKYYSIFILSLTICVFAIINKILMNNLLIFYFPLVSIFITLYLMIKTYVKKQYKIKSFYINN